MHRLLVLIVGAVLLPQSVKSARKNSLKNPSNGQNEFLEQQLEQQAFSAEPGSLQAKQKWNEILELNPRSANALMQLGIMDMSSPDPIKSQRAFAMIEKSFGRGVDKPVSRTFQQGSLLAGLAGRRRAHLNEYPQAVKFLTIGLEGNPADTCMALQLATVLSYYPKSVAEADRGYELYHARIDELLSRPASAALVRPEHLLMAGNNDPYSHCTLSLFVHSFYYRGDPASAALKHFQAATRAFPDLLYVAPHLTRQGAKKTKKGSGMKSSKGGNAAVARGGSCRRVKLGVASAFFSHASSVTDDFRGVMERLSRDVFEITFIYFMESATPPDPYILEKKDKHLLIDGRAPHWFESARRDIANLQLDVLLYLDLTMSTWIQKMAYSRLATVQATSHGHPVTSGVPKHIMQYYISWAAAELPYEEAKLHYTEELKLLPADKMHQFYRGRLTKDGRSANSGGSAPEAAAYAAAQLGDGGSSGSSGVVLSTKGRRRFQDLKLPLYGNWYVCMQKPFKRQPEFDTMLAGVLEADPEAVLILHDVDGATNRKILEERLDREGADLDRIYWLSALPHHRLLDLYALADVILDSFPAGGCTTTREALELGKAVVTLPGRLLGGRWSLALYSMMGSQELNQQVVAEDEKDYVEKAVRIGTSAEVRASVELSIRKHLPRLFGQSHAVEEWTKILLEIAPPEATGDDSCGASIIGSSGSESDDEDDDEEEDNEMDEEYDDEYDDDDYDGDYDDEEYDDDYEDDEYDDEYEDEEYDDDYKEDDDEAGANLGGGGRGTSGAINPSKAAPKSKKEVKKGAVATQTKQPTGRWPKGSAEDITEKMFY